MSRISNLIERIEKLARKFGMSIEEVIDILEGKHPTHCVVVKDPVDEKGAAENPTASGATSNTTTPPDMTASTASAPTAGTNASSDAGNGASAGAAETPNPVPAIESAGAEAGAANTGEQA